MPAHTQSDLDKVLRAGRKGITALYAGPMLELQRKSLIDVKVRGPQWVSKTMMPAPPECDARDILLAAIKDLGDGSEQYAMPESSDVPVQWVAYRPGIGRDELEPPNKTEREKFDALTADVKSDLVIMYMYGGAHTTNGPASRRATAAILSKHASARCCIVQHRLAPQNPFPNQILDVLHCYLSLLYPPPGSFHQPIKPQNLVLAADSSGCSLAMSIIQILLSTHRRHRPNPPTISFHAHSIPLPLPAGVAVQSPHWDSNTRSLPSYASAAASDILPDKNPSIALDYKFDSAWPASPARAHVYCESPTLAHPLASPMLATRWAGAPPIYIAAGGGERLLDAARVVAQTAARQRVPVLWDEYERMPHNWPMLLRGWPQSERCMRAWASACVGFAARGEKGEVVTRGSVVAFEPGADGEREVREVDVGSLTGLTAEEVRRLAWRGIELLEEEAKGVMEIWRREGKSKF